MPRTLVCSVQEARERFEQWLTSAANTGFVLHSKKDPDSGELSRMALVAVSEKPAAEDTPAARYMDTPDHALQAVRDAAEELGDKRALLREWLDAAIELEALPGNPVQGLLVRRFSLIGIRSGSPLRRPDGTCTVRAFTHVTRLESTDELAVDLPVQLADAAGEPVPTKRPPVVSVHCASGEWDTYVISRLRLHTPLPAPYRIRLLAPDRSQVLWELPLDVAAPPIAGGAADAGAEGTQEEEDAEGDEGLLE